jgi:DNA-binding CsgD family transcriptional regulator
MARNSLSEENFFTLVGRLYDSAFSSEEISDVLRELKDLFNAVCVVSAASPASDRQLPSSPPPASLSWAIGIEPQLLAAFTARFTNEDQNPFLKQIRRAPINKPFLLAEMMDRRTFFNHPIYQEGFRLGGVEHGIGTVLAKDNSLVRQLNIYRGEKQGDFSPREVKFFRQFGRHFARVLELRWQLLALEEQHAAIDKALNAIAQGVILLDRYGLVLFTNQVAESILQAGDALYLRGRQLVIRNSAQCRLLDELVSRCSHPVGDTPAATPSAIAINRPQARPLTAVILPCCSTNFIYFAHTPAVIILISDPDAGSLLQPRILEQLFKLTPAEARLATQVASGRTLEESAVELGISRNTAATHLRHIFEKTNVHRQSDLVRLILQSPAAACIPPAINPSDERVVPLAGHRHH